jgi:hypothetical protein
MNDVTQRTLLAATAAGGILTAAGAAVVYSTRALDAFDAAAEINPNA